MGVQREPRQASPITPNLQTIICLFLVVFDFRVVRIDDIIVFTPLTKDQIKGIIELSFADLRKRLADKDITLELTDKALDFIADEAYDPHYGARPIKRFLQQQVETEIAEGIIRGSIVDGQNLVCDSDGEKLIYS